MRPTVPAPRVPGALRWSAVGRVFGRGVAAVTLLGLVALVAWPERAVRTLMVGSTFDDGTITWQRFDDAFFDPITNDQGEIRTPVKIEVVQRPVRDSSLAVLLGD